jgi:phosphotriesterase-related protein
MPKSDMTGKIQTVLGPIEPEQMGITMTHEHLLVDLMAYFHVPDEASLRSYADRPITMDMLGKMGQIWAMNKANLQYYDEKTSVEEVLQFAHAGGGGIVDTTDFDLARDPLALQRISRATGLNVVMGSGHYVPLAHPANMDDLTEQEITERIVSDVTVGIRDTGVKSGIIGELGNVYPLSENERKALRAAARAQAETGAPISVHPGANDDSCMQIMDVLVESGADPKNVIMGHQDFALKDFDKMAELAATGCYMEHDIFGFEDTNLVYMGGYADMKSDAQRIEALEFMTASGHLDQILVAQDVCQSRQLTRYGGKGYAHILQSIVPRLKGRGFTQDQIDTILVANPARALAFA